MADARQNEITNLLHRYDLFTRHEKPLPKGQRKAFYQGRWVTVIDGWESPNRATPDLTGGNRYQIHVEVKNGKNNRFDFAAWEDHQREWARTYRETYGVEYWCGIIIETKHSPHRVKRVAFIVPYPAMIAAEEIISPIQKSILYRAVKGSKRELQDKKLDAEHLWAEFALQWKPAVGWEFPETHPFYQMYLADRTPYLYTGSSITKGVAYGQSLGNAS